MTDNELIAEFMGGQFHRLDDGFGVIRERWYFLRNPNPHANASTYKSKEDLEYDKRWDWLMPVVEKINKLYHETFPTDFVQKVLAKERNIIDEHYIEVVALPMGTPINEVYKNVIEFIKWYNQNKP